MTRTFNVLFLCTDNSARSILAEYIVNRVGTGKFVAYSAGSMPKGEVHPHAIRLLEELGYDTSGLRSKSWGEFATPNAPKLDFIITLCDHATGQVCPQWPGEPVQAHWGIPDPATVEGQEHVVGLAFVDAYLLLSDRIDRFANVPFDGLDRLAIKRRIDEIGQPRPPS